MNQIFDKLGVYDLMSILLSGICITTFSLGIVTFIFQLPWLSSLRLIMEDTIPFLVISYLVGLFFQELSSLLYNLFFLRKGNKLLEKAFDTSDHMFPCLTVNEKKAICTIVENTLERESSKKIKIDQEVIYNFCKFYLINNNYMTRANMDQTTFGLSRSLSLYFFCAAFVIFVYGCTLTTISIPLIGSGIILFLISALLYFRCIRFAKLRYVNMLRAFYYSWLQRDFLQEKQTSKK